MTRRRVWNDRALESPAAGYLLTGAGAAIFTAAAITGLAATVTRGPLAVAVIAVLCAAAGAAVFVCGCWETARARQHRDSMRAYGSEITASFEKLLAERDQGPCE